MSGGYPRVGNLSDQNWGISVIAVTCSTGYFTAAPSSTSPAIATASEPTKPAPNNTQPLQSHHPGVGNFADQLWGTVLIAVSWREGGFR